MEIFSEGDQDSGRILARSILQELYGLKKGEALGKMFYKEEIVEDNIANMDLTNGTFS